MKDSAQAHRRKYANASLAGAGVSLLFVVGWLDYITGPEVALAILYLFPIVLVTWWGGRGMGVAAAFAGAMVWLGANHIAAAHADTLVVYWNAAAWLGFFLIVVFLLSKLKTDKEHLEETVVKRTAALESEMVERAQAEDRFDKAFHAARRRAEDSITRSEMRKDAILQSAVDGIITVDQEGKILEFNPAMEKIFGYTREEVVGREMAELIIPPALRAKHREGLSRYLTTGEGPVLGKRIEMMAMRADGSEFPVELSIVRVGKETPQMFTGFIHDITERKRAENALHDQQEFLRSIIDTNPNLIFARDWDGRFTLVNKALADIYGTTIDYLVGKGDADFNPDKKEVEHFLHDDREVMETGSPKLIAEEPVTNPKTGETRWFQTIKVLLGSPEGRGSQVLGVATDITQRKRAEKLQNAVYLIAQAADGSQHMDDLYRAVHEIIREVMLAENFYIALFDERENLLRFPYFVDEVDLPPDAREPRRGLTEYVLRTGRSLLCDAGLHAELQRRGEVELHGAPCEVWLGVPLMVENKTIGAMVVQNYSDRKAYGERERQMLEYVSSQVAKTIERKRREGVLRESEERFRTLFEEDLTGDFISTPDGRLLACNRAFARIFGFSSVEEALQWNVADLYVSPEKRQEFLQLLRERKRLEYHEAELRRRDGTRVYVVENIVGSFGDDGELAEIKGYLFDDTQRRQLEQQLIQAQKMESLGALAGGIAHDFNNILGIMLGHLSLLEVYRSEPDKASESIDVLRKSVQRGTALVRQLLTFARKSEVNFQSISLGLLVQELVKILSATFPKTITFTVQLREDVPLIVGDHNQLYQAFLNLAVNARDAMPQGGTLSIGLKATPGSDVKARFRDAQSEQYLSITLSDDGIGMDEATKRRIFEPFFTTKGVGKGTGLGLALVYGVVKSHNGHVEVESAPGKGTSFTIYFPAASQTMATSPVDETEIAEVRGGSETILLVEDEEMLRSSVNTLLQSKGYRVLTATDGDMALVEYQEHKNEIALVLSDVGLPKRSGWKVLQMMKEINPTVKAIIASGYIDPTVKSEMLKVGARDFVQKPYMPGEILKKIRSVLDEAA